MLELFLENRSLIQKLLVALLFVLALWRGGAPEKACASILLGMVSLQLVLYELAGLDSDFSNTNLVGIVIDTIGLLAFLAVSLRANRFYPMVLAAAQLVAFTSHLVQMLVEPISSLAYYLLYAMPFWFQILILAGGLWRHAYRASSSGHYRDWRVVPPLRAEAGYS